VAIDQNPAPTPALSTDVPIIENELPAYRAISTAAVLSLVTGVGSVFCYADLWFLLLAAAAVLLGLSALKSIRRYPDVLTGSAIAKVGIGIALLFAATAITRLASTDVYLRIDAGRFAKFYATVIKDEPVSVALFYSQPPLYRKEKTPDDMIEEMKKARSPAAPDAYEEKAAPIVLMKKRLAGNGEAIRYDSIETRLIDGLTTYANALLILEGPGSAEFPEKEQHALISMVKGSDGGKLDWVVSDVKFPYKPKSAPLTVQKKDDDGHGHGH